MTIDSHNSRFARQPREYVEFMIDDDGFGETGSYTSNPDALADFFGANPSAPNYLTPVHFRKNVLDKYFQKPSKYTVESGIIRCGYQWGLPIDNDHDSKVCAWLGDLGRIPYDEQLHWRAYNVQPSGTLSESFFKNQILAEATDSSRPEHLFLTSYCNLQKVCQQYLGWLLLIPLSVEDMHNLKTLRIPSTDEQREFDELVLSLTKIIIDSINEKKLKEIFSNQCNCSSMSGINLLEYVLQYIEVEDFSSHTLFLRRLQRLRSSGVAHWKGESYKRISNKLGIGSNRLREVFTELLENGTDFLDFLTSLATDGRLENRL